MMNHWGSLSPYEQFKSAEILSRRPNGGTVTGIVLGGTALLAGIGAWVFGPLVSNAKANGIRDLANAQFQANNAQIAALSNLLGTERAERVAQGVTLTQTVTDTVSGSQQGTLTAQQAAELAASQATQQIMQQTFSDAVTGRSQLCPQPVMLYSSPQPCGCPGCNG